MEEVCPICLDPQVGCGSVQLFCGHVFHAECVLASFSGNPASEWRCPICRAAIVRKTKGLPGYKRSQKSTCDVVELENGASFSRMSRWASLTAFLDASAAAIADQQAITDPSSDSQDSENGKNGLRKAYYPSSGTCCSKSEGLGAQILTGLDFAVPGLCTIVIAFAGHCHVQKLLNPKTPAPWVLAARYAASIIASISVIAVGVLALRTIMDIAGPAVCLIAEHAQHAVDGLHGQIKVKGAPSLAYEALYEEEEECVPLVPDGWAMPIGFSAIGAYITSQVCWMFGISLRHAALHWDRCAGRGLMLWFGVCVLYTMFVYTARLLLTLAMVLTGTISNAVISPSDLYDNAIMQTIHS